MTNNWLGKMMEEILLAPVDLGSLSQSLRPWTLYQTSQFGGLAKSLKDSQQENQTLFLETAQNLKTQHSLSISIMWRLLLSSRFPNTWEGRLGRCLGPIKKMDILIAAVVNMWDKLPPLPLALATAGFLNHPTTNRSRSAFSGALPWNTVRR